jgi:glucose-6-phosphate isomerase
LNKWQNLAWLGKLSEMVAAGQSKIESEEIVERLWNHDHTIWKDSADEITNRLGWLHSPREMQEAVKEIIQFVTQIKSEGFDRALLLGMGGSSLAPEVFALTFGIKSGFLDLHVLDSTDPDSVINATRYSDGGKTLFIVSTKSGGTIETMSFMKHFYQKMIREHGSEKAGSYFIAITDPGSGLETMAGELGFRKIFLNDPNIGGRFSALTYFGLVPAALVGIDISQILVRAQNAAELAHHSESPAVYLGTLMGVLASAGKDKLTFLISPKIKYLGAWLEQLIAESSGKEKKGILPVDLEAVQPLEYYGMDRLFVHLKLKGDDNFDETVGRLIDQEFPVVEFELDDKYDIGAQYFMWETATAIACHFLKINPFDQPNVESAKILAKAKMTGYLEDGNLVKPENPIIANNMAFITNLKENTLENILSEFLGNASVGDEDGKGRSYVSIHAYLDSNEKVSSVLHNLQSRIHRKTKMATTLGFGPRFLHSTGQLHKGDAGHGLFIQIVGKYRTDLPVPVSATDSDSQYSFGILREAQSLGDREALLNEGREVLRIEIGNDHIADIEKLISAIKI